MSWLPGRMWSLHLIAVVFAALLSNVKAQFLQDYEWQNNLNGNPLPLWREQVGKPYIAGVILSPTIVVLEYNCFWMSEICVNAETWVNSYAGRRHRIQGVFGYDMRSKRKNARRRRSCPTGRLNPYSWSNTHTCPERGVPQQRLPMKSTGPWFYTELDPFDAGLFPVKHLRGNDNRILVNSAIRYSCDEFPPASWIEGGGDQTPPALQNLLNHGDAKTRCAAITCPGAPRGTKAEQN